MSRELVYTSAPRGVRPGSQGFCTVAHTQGMPANLIQQLESLSGYRQIFSPQDPKASLNPVVFSHLVLTLAGRRCHVLSRICDAGLDYTQRTNKFAHHVVLDDAEVPAAGPAWLLAQPKFMQNKWTGEPEVFPTGPVLPSGESKPRVCRAWQQITGDAGWAGVLAETATGPTSRQAVLVFQPGTEMLPLLVETLTLLPAELRWRISFSTYFTKLPAGVACQWRCVVDGTPEAITARRAPQAALVIDLGHPLGRPTGGAYVEAARTGKGPAAVTTAERLSDTELGYALQQSGRPPIHAGIELPVPSDAQVPYCDVAPPPVSSRWNRPPRRQLSHPTWKPAPRWPWALAAAALVFVVGGVGVLAWIARFNTDRGTATSEGNKKKVVEVARTTVPKEANPLNKGMTLEVPKATMTNANGKEPQKTMKQQGQGQVVTEKTNPEHKDTPAEKKRGDVPNAAVAKNANGKESKAEQEPAKPDPLRDVRGKAYDVPRYKYVSVVGRNPSRPEWFPLAPLPVSRTKWEISLVASTGIPPDTWTFRPLKQSYSSATSGIFDCTLEKPIGMGGQTQTARIAGFRVDSKGVLNIKWDEDNKHTGLANALRNCPLRITMPDCDEAIVYLRTPVSDSPIMFNDLTQQDHIVRQLSVDDMPDIPVEIEVLPPLPTGILKPEMKGDKPQAWLLRAEADNAICFCLQVEHKGREPNIEVTFADQGTKLGEDTVYAHSITAYIKAKEAEKKALDDDKGEKENELNSGKLHRDEKKERSDAIGKIAEKIDKLEKRISKAKMVEGAYRKITEGGKLYYRVYLPTDKYRVDLIRAEQRELVPNAAASQTP